MRDDIAVLEKSEYDKLVKDRLDFGFDSIYFRYAEMVKELRRYKELYDRSGIDYKNWETVQLSHFWNTLEQLVNAHPYEGKW